MCHSTAIAAAAVAMEWHLATDLVRSRLPRHDTARIHSRRNNKMSMFNKVTKSFQWGNHNVRLETGEIARQANGAVIVDMEDTVVLATVVAKRGEAGPGLLPAHGGLHREDLRRRQDPRRLLQARRPAVREGNAHLAPDRSPARPLFPEGFYNEVQVVVTCCR